MKKPRHHRKKKKGIVGIEAAIVLIAFVIVAAALAFVVLNMGMFTTQKSKEVISRGLEESTSALQVAGTITAEVENGAPYVDAVAIPIQVAPGREAIDLSTNVTTIFLQTPKNTYTNTHEGVWALYYDSSKDDYYLVWIGGVLNVAKITQGANWLIRLTNATLTIDGRNYTAIDLNTSTPPSLSLLFNKTKSVVLDLLNTKQLTNSISFIVFTQWNKGSTILKFGDKALVLVLLGSDDLLTYYQQFTVELRPPVGAPLTITRSLPASLTPGTLIALS
ncbi:MAG: hypothetical protein GXO43_03065 [Crenarchaeota archaeon]|nr:hypothetical protein [Thermoproteota archaeon]